MTGNTSPTSEVLMETEVDVLSNQQCKASGVPASMISDDHICASGDFENQGVCKGDSGNRNFWLLIIFLITPHRWTTDD